MPKIRFFPLENIATQEKICQELTPFRTLASNPPSQKTEVPNEAWENDTSENNDTELKMTEEEDSHFLTQFTNLPPLVQLNILQLYNVWISQDYLEMSDDAIRKWWWSFLQLVLKYKFLANCSQNWKWIKNSYSNYFSLPYYKSDTCTQSIDFELDFR